LPARRVHRAAHALAVQQDASGGVQSGGAGRSAGRHAGHHTRRQRRELLRGVAQLHRPHEEPGGQVQRFAVRRPVRTR